MLLHGDSLCPVHDYRCGRVLQKKAPKKLGRPVTFRGDPESSQLSDGERKRIKRRIANRESARRVRQKRQVLMEELHCKVGPRRASSRIASIV